MAVSKSPMEALIAAAKENEKREKEKALQNNLTVSPVKEETPSTAKKTNESSDVKSDSNKSASDDALSAGFSKYLVKCGKEASVVVQIPARIHQEIKLVSFLSGAPINSIVANVLEEFLTKNEKEIAKLKKKIK